MNLTYDPVASMLTEVLSDLTTPSNTPVTISTNVNLATLLGSNTAYIGFTGGTGGANSIQQISSFTSNLNVNVVSPTSTYGNNVSVTGNSGLSVAGSLAVTMGDLSIGSALNVTSPDTSTNPYSVTFAGATGITTLTGNATFNINNSTGGGAGMLVLGTLNDGGTARTIGFGGTGAVTLNHAATSLVVGTQVNITGGTLNSNVGGTATSPGSLGSFARERGQRRDLGARPQRQPNDQFSFRPWQCESRQQHADRWQHR